MKKAGTMMMAMAGLWLIGCASNPRVTTVVPEKGVTYKMMTVENALVRSLSDSDYPTCDLRLGNSQTKLLVSNLKTSRFCDRSFLGKQVVVGFRKDRVVYLNDDLAWWADKLEKTDAPAANPNTAPTQLEAPTPPKPVRTPRASVAPPDSAPGKTGTPSPAVATPTILR